jgi:hypothetical protein
VAEASADELDLPYRLELNDALGQVERVLATCGSANLAFSLFYSAQREFFERSLTLRLGHHVLAQTRG